MLGRMALALLVNRLARIARGRTAHARIVNSLALIVGQKEIVRFAKRFVATTA